ncbi:hypothetical protein [Mucilaginibacter gotjawali]
MQKVGLFNLNWHLNVRIAVGQGFSDNIFAILIKNVSNLHRFLTN